MADAVKAVGQDMQQETADELVWTEPHHLVPAGTAIIFETERDLLFGDRDEPRIGDGGTMRIAGEIGQDLGRSAEGWLDIDDPFCLPKCFDAIGESVLIFEGSKSAEEAQIAILECGYKPGEEQTPEQARERVDRQEEVWAAGDPAISIR